MISSLIAFWKLYVFLLLSRKELFPYSFLEEKDFIVCIYIYICIRTNIYIYIYVCVAKSTCPCITYEAVKICAGLNAFNLHWTYKFQSLALRALET